MYVCVNRSNLLNIYDCMMIITVLFTGFHPYWLGFSNHQTGIWNGMVNVHSYS